MLCTSYDDLVKYGNILANLHKGNITADSSAQEIAAASVGTKLDKNGKPIITSPKQGLEYTASLRKSKGLFADVSSGAAVNGDGAPVGDTPKATKSTGNASSGTNPQGNNTTAQTGGTVPYTGTSVHGHSEDQIHQMENDKGTFYVFYNIYGGDINKYDPYKRASELTGIPLEKDGKTPVNCGSAGKEAFNNALFGNKANDNYESNLSGTNTTQLFRESGQSNGSQYSYTFTEEFNSELQKIVNDVVDSVVNDNLSDSDKETLKEILPYIIKGIGSSESSWSNNSEGYVGLTSNALKSINTWGFVTFGSGYECNINTSSYSTPIEGAKIAAEMLVHMTSCDMGNDGTEFDDALYNSWVQYCGGTENGGQYNAAYQMGMANDFYNQDHKNSELFSNVFAVQSTINNLDKYGVYTDENATLYKDVIINPDGVEVKNR